MDFRLQKSPNSTIHVRSDNFFYLNDYRLSDVLQDYNYGRYTYTQYSLVKVKLNYITSSRAITLNVGFEACFFLQ